LESPPSSPPVLIVTAGGLEHGGGIGRMIGYMVEGWAGAAGAPDWRVLDTRGARVDARSPIRFLRALLTLLGAAPRRPLLHIHIAGRGSTLRKLIVGAWARRLGLRVVLHLHDYDYRAFCDGLPRWAFARVRTLFRSADLVVVLGSADADLARAHLGVDPDRVAIMANAVCAPTPPVTHAAGPAVRILFLGRLSDRKGVPELIAALADPTLASLPWRATLAGDGEIERYRDQARDAGIADRIEFPGWLDRHRTSQLLRDSDILVLPSYQEGMAMSVLEGLAFGLCVVCTPVGALAEVIEDDVSGILVQAGDAGGLAAALALAIREPARRHRLAQAGEALFRQRFEARGYAERMLALYCKALALPPQRKR
jgi:glycosyltransferase involved in cell wall biosynthesis